MLKDHLFNEIISQFNYKPTENQLELFKKISEFCFSQSQNPVFIINGYAGTGKTSALAAISAGLVKNGLKNELLASTGRAAKVLSSFCGRPALTIHKKIYRQRSMKDGVGSFSLNINLADDTLFIVDEASMISTQSAELSIFGSGNVLEDLVEFVFSKPNCRLVLVGDDAQLPPVNEQESPALQASTFKKLGCTIFQAHLSEITRQAEDSGILINATYIRTAIETKLYAPLLFETKGFTDIKKIDGSQFLEEMEQSCDTYGMDEVAVICKSNKMANKYNEYIRNRLLFREEKLTRGDKLLVVKNNYFWLPENEEVAFIANGDFVTLKRLKKIKEVHGFHFAECELALQDNASTEFDALLLLEAIDAEGPTISQAQSRSLYDSVLADYMDISPAKKRYEKIKADPFYNSLHTKYGYSLTCHKAQGGQWKVVFIDAGMFKREKDDNSTEILKWMYTAFTRASEKLYLVNFSESYFYQ